MPETVGQRDSGDEPPKRVNNPTGKGGFRDNPRPGPGRGKKKPKDSIGERAYADMHQAYSTPETKGEPPGVKAARDLLHEDYKKFMEIFSRLTPHGTSEPAGDEGEVAAAATGKVLKIEELIESLLTEWDRDANALAHGELTGEAP